MRTKNLLDYIISLEIVLAYSKYSINIFQRNKSIALNNSEHL